MSIAATALIVRSAFETSLHRYARSWGLWVLLLLSPIAARLWIGDPGGVRAAIAINDKAPIMTSAMLGVSLGIVVSTLLLPAAFIYFRASVTRRQPWQIAEVTGASRIAGAAGHFLADVAVACAALAALTLAGFVIGLVSSLPGGFHPGEIVFGLWVIALPALMMVAALRRLLDALPWTRGALGEVIAVVLWIAALAGPAASQHGGSGAMAVDLGGFMAPLTATLPPGEPNISIGGGPDTHGTIALDVSRGLMAHGYLVSRLLWVVLAITTVMVAGAVYRPHLARASRRMPRWTRWLTRPVPLPPLVGPVHAARSVAVPFVGVVVAEFRLIGRGRVWRSAALLVALASAVVDYRHAAGPAALLLLIFGMTAQIGRAEQPRLLALTGTMTCPPWVRRGAFVLAAIGWATAMALPAIVRGLAAGQGEPLLLAVCTAAVAAMVAMLLGTLTRGAFAPRLVLLIGWYVWLSV